MVRTHTGVPNEAGLDVMAELTVAGAVEGAADTKSITDAAAEPSAMPSAGTDAASRAARRTWRERLNDQEARTLIAGTIATLVGGTFWGFSGTCASYLFEHYQVDTAWLMSVRQVFSGLLFIIIALIFDRARLIKLWTTPTHRRELLIFAAGGVLFNQFFYLASVRLTNAGTATVLQCLQLLIILAVSCLRGRRAPRRREVLGIALALAGTYLLATGGNPGNLSIPPAGIAVGLLCAVGAAAMAILPARILPVYGSNIVTGSAMLSAGVASSLVVHPWQNVPPLQTDGWLALFGLVVIGSFLAYLLYMQGVKDVGSMRASLLGTIEPISATITSAVTLGTVFAPTDIAGFALIIVMVFLTV